MSLTKVENHHVARVLSCVLVFRDTPADQFKMQASLAIAEGFSAVDLWLLSFVGWAVNTTRTPIIDHNDYVMLVCSAKQQSEFRDFVALIKLYRGTRIPRKKEKELIRFLVGCTEELREFYLLLLDQPSWLHQFVRNQHYARTDGTERDSP